MRPAVFAQTLVCAGLVMGMLSHSEPVPSVLLATAAVLFLVSRHARGAAPLAAIAQAAAVFWSVAFGSLPEGMATAFAVLGALVALLVWLTIPVSAGYRTPVASA